jgi:DNA polymerase
MGEQQAWSLEGAVQSYAHWWREAGLHTATDALAHGWREMPAAPFWQGDAAETARSPVQGHAGNAAPAPRLPDPPAAATRPAGMPDTLPAFLDWLAQDETQPEALWDGPIILPPAIAQARLMLIVEMPAAGARDAETLIEPGQRRFIDAMLAGIGLTPGDTALVSLATRRPPGGLIDEDMLARLTGRMTHYLGLARPKAAIILGDRTSRALIGAQWSASADQLQKVNHGGGTMDALALAGLELLMSRPAAKARSWRTLRHLHAGNSTGH